MRFFVTGGNGFIGSNFVTHLAEQDEIVYTMIRGQMGQNLVDLAYLSRRTNFHVVSGDVLNYGQLFKIISAVEPDIIVHIAAESHVAKSIRDPYSHIQTNILGTYNLLQIAKDLKISRFAYMSTCEVYGDYPGILTEESPFHPNSPYAASKAAADCLVQSYGTTYNLPYTIFRPANNYGPGQHIEKVIPKFLKQANTTKKLSVHGSGQQAREWIYVKDCVYFMYELLKRIDIPPDIYNISVSDRASIELIAKTIAYHTKSKVEYIENRQGQVSQFTMSNEKLRTKLKKRPSYSLLDYLKQMCAPKDKL